MPREKNITPSWLKVDKAIIFFISNSNIAAAPAINMVTQPNQITIVIAPLLSSIKLNRIIKYTPAVTKVEECTSAETGVGAAIAAGSQAEKGTCALLVIAAIIIKKKKKKLNPHW